jgi:hypothetical protein
MVSFALRELGDNLVSRAETELMPEELVCGGFQHLWANGVKPVVRTLRHGKKGKKEIKTKQE